MELQYQTEPSHEIELNQLLRMELGWNDVRGGLGRVLFGYFVFLVGTLVGTGMVIWSAWGWLIGENNSPSQLPDIGQMWIFYVGLGILSVVGTFGYLFILAGQWKCLLAAPERQGARWLMFFATTCLFLGPAVNVASFIGGVQRAPQLSRGVRSLGEMQFSLAGQYLQLTSAGAGLLYAVFFILFLRAVARCHDSRHGNGLANFCLVLVVLLVAGSGFWLYTAFYGIPLRGELRQVPFLVAGGWLMSFFLYLYLIASVRRCIADSLNRIRSPYDY
jgi:hypothetical protein